MHPKELMCLAQQVGGGGGKAAPLVPPLATPLEYEPDLLSISH